MRKQQLLAAVVALLFISLCVWAVTSQRQQLQFKQLEIDSTSSKLKTLHLKYDSLNKQLDKTKQDDQVSADKIKQLEEERQRLEAEKQELERQLQAKLDAKNRLKQAGTEVANAVTNTTTVSASSGGSTVSGDSIEQIVRDAAVKYGIDPDYAVHIARCESGLNPNAVNYSYNDNGFPSGIYQHLSGYWPARAAKYGWSGASVFNAQANAEVTMGMWRDGQQGLWECR